MKASEKLIKKILFKRMCAWVKEFMAKAIEDADLKEKDQDEFLDNLKKEIEDQIDTIYDTLMREVETAEWYVETWIDDVLDAYKDKYEDEAEQDAVWEADDNDLDDIETVICASKNPEDEQCKECYHSKSHIYEGKTCGVACGMDKESRCVAEEVGDVVACGGL